MSAGADVSESRIAADSSQRQRCLAHTARNLLDKAPDSARREVKAMIQAAYYHRTEKWPG